MTPLLLLSIAASSSPLPQGWEVHEAADFCYAWRGVPDQAGTEFGIALDTGERPTIILSNQAWPLKENRTYRVSAGVPGAFKSLRARSMGIGGGRLALAADINDSKFVERLVASPQLQFELQKPDAGPSSGSFMLHGAPEAVAALKSCQKKLAEKAKDFAKYKKDNENSFRPDPPADWVPPAPKN